VVIVVRPSLAVVGVPPACGGLRSGGPEGSHIRAPSEPGVESPVTRLLHRHLARVATMTV